MRLTLIAMMLILVLSAGTTLAAQAPLAPASGAPQISAAELLQVSLPVAGSSETLRVFAGRSLVVQSPDPLKRVSVTDPAIASAVVVAPEQIMIHGLKPGTVTLLLRDEQERLRSFDLQVQLDVRPVIGTIKQVFPKRTSM